MVRTHPSQPTDKPLVMSGFFVSVGWDGCYLAPSSLLARIWFVLLPISIVSLLACALGKSLACGEKPSISYLLLFRQSRADLYNTSTRPVYTFHTNYTNSHKHCITHTQLTDISAKIFEISFKNIEISVDL